MRQKLGQHFLTNPDILDRIAQAACGEQSGLVIEIGPGRGALTEHLLPRSRKLIAVELDAALAAHIEERFDNQVTVIQGDALHVDYQSWQPDVICGNLPYYVATPILERIVELGIPVVALIQKEVADRMIAQPGTREYGYLTVRTRLFAEARRLFLVKPGAFRPPPKVDSAVVRLTPAPRAAALGITDTAEFVKFLGRCFRFKRKTLRNNLVAFYPDVADGRRGEECSMEDLAELYLRLTRSSVAAPEA